MKLRIIRRVDCKGKIKFIIQSKLGLLWKWENANGSRPYRDRKDTFDSMKEAKENLDVFRDCKVIEQDIVYTESN